MELIVENVGHRYGDVVALERIDLTVRKGEILAVIGPSGCGKSTLLGIMGGILQPSEGRVLVRGEPPSGSLNPFTYIFQDFALLPWRTVEGNVALALEHHPLSAAERKERVEHVLSRTGLLEFRRSFPKQLSGGMRQRVGIARALVVRPAILLLDEPLSALDAQTRDLLMEDFLALWLEQRTTAVYVTHNLSEALRVADRVAVLSRRPGRLRELVAIDLPQAERATPSGQVQLAVLGQKLWDLIRQEAQVAEREVRVGDMPDD
ncbi:MAG TPA: ABC transporter ATP-binding protein [Alphaproteobacteria bacterium]|nr:ABC transporter ATP-binding protein [Alphaproteobacteria bacterium]